MIKKNEALRHANKLDAHEFDEPHGAAAELRRLTRAEAQRDALLEALKRIVDWDAAGLALTEDHAAQARAAINKAEENT